jgi:hypothetical protein
MGYVLIKYMYWKFAYKISIHSKCKVFGHFAYFYHITTYKLCNFNLIVVNSSLQTMSENTYCFLLAEN